MAEDLPSPESRVTRRPADGRIVTARAAARRRHAPSACWRGPSACCATAGYDAILTQHFDIAMNSHQCGTVVAGRDPATSVLDPWCRSHDVRNLWVDRRRLLPLLRRR